MNWDDLLFIENDEFKGVHIITKGEFKVNKIVDKDKVGHVISTANKSKLIKDF